MTSALVWLRMGQGPSSYKNFELHEGEDLCEGLNIYDVTLNFGSCDEILGSSRSHTAFNFENGATDCQLMEKNASLTESNDNVENDLEVLSSDPYYLVLSSCIFIFIFSCNIFNLLIWQLFLPFSIFQFKWFIIWDFYH